MKRREVLIASCTLMACATLPRERERLPGSGARDRVCDHDLCKYWRATAATEPGSDFKVGQCSVGVPEDL